MKKLHNLFNINGKPLELTKGQQQIFYSIIDLPHPRVQVIAPTQYGKTLTVALAILTSAVAMGEKFSVLAPSEKKASILMRYVIEHTFDQDMFMRALELQDNITLDRLRRERSREHLTFKGGGGVQVLSLDARNTKRNIEAVMGFGGNRLILDESSLIEDNLYSTVKRMLGGYKYKDTFLLEIGNPFYRNHFLRTWHGDRYHKIFIDYKQGLKEGRYSPEFIEEAKEEAYFDVFYECKFPEADTIDARGYRTLLTDIEVNKAKGTVKRLKKPFKLGADIGGGGDYNVYVVRGLNYAWVEAKNQSTDTMTNVNEIKRIMKKYKIQARDVFVDDVGIGRGVTDRLKELGIKVNGVASGAKAKDTTRYKNKKAEMGWLLRNWVKQKDTKIEDTAGFNQLNWIKYKVSTDRVIQIESKQELVKRTGKSPDFYDALALTFAPPKPRPSVSFL